jgi:translocation and assembly module TamB
VALDITVDLPGRVFLRGRGLESEWGGALAVRGTAAAPEVTGKIAHRRGFLDLLDRRFTLERGDIAFDGRRPPVPEVDILAASQGVDIRALVGLSGPADKLKIELTADPPVPRDEVLSRLLFGRSAGQITPAQGLRLAMAVRQLESGDDGPLDLLRQGLGLDTLDVGGSSPDDAGARAGRYVADGVYLEVERGLTPQSGRARVEVELTPRIRATTEVTEQSQTGVQLQWRYDW